MNVFTKVIIIKIYLIYLLKKLLFLLKNYYFRGVKTAILVNYSFNSFNTIIGFSGNITILSLQY